MKTVNKKSAVADNLFEDLGFSAEESRVLTLKAQLATLIVRLTRARQLSQKDLGKLWGVPQPRVSEVMTGKLNLISIERLIEFLGALDVEIVFRAKSSRKKAS